jgi:DNA-binding CsgD family transcriptional regulator
MTEVGSELAFERLTPREREILRLVAQHRRSKEIARLLALSPKTVEMHVLSARRRLAGLNRRDAALAFIAWEAESHPGSDYRTRSAPLAEPDRHGLDQREPRTAYDPHIHPIESRFVADVSGDLDRAGGGLEPSGGDAGTVPTGAGSGLGPAQVAGRGRDARTPSDEHSERGHLPVRRPGVAWRIAGGRLDGLTSLQLFALTVVLAVVLGLVLGGVVMAAHNFLYALQRWREGWAPPV